MSELEQRLAGVLADIINGAGKKTLGSHARTCPVPVGLLEQARDLLVEYQRLRQWNEGLDEDTGKEVNRASNRVF